MGEVEDLLRQYPGRFDFFQAVRLLLRMHAGPRSRWDGSPGPSQEAVRFSVHNTLVFPPTRDPEDPVGRGDPADDCGTSWG